MVLDGGERDYDFTAEVTAVTASFHNFSSQSCGGIARYEWAVGHGTEGPLRESLLSFTSQGIVDNGDGSGHAQLPLPGLRDLGNRRIYITVRGITGCEDILESTSNGFIIDTSPPSVEVVGTGNQAIEHAQGNSSDHMNYQSFDTYSSIWRAADPQSGLADDAMVRVGTFPGGDDVTSSRRVSGNYIRDRIVSMEGRPIYVTVTATNGAGVESSAISEPISLDTTPPAIGEV